MSWRWATRYAEIARQYPKIGRYVFIYHPDLQGPMDICEVVWGSAIFYAIRDEPALVKDLLELAVETYICLHAPVGADRAVSRERQHALGPLLPGQRSCCATIRL